MKSKIKMTVTILIIIILVSGLSVYATYNYFAKDIWYTKEDGTTISVEKALNELYNNTNSTSMPSIDSIWLANRQSVDYTYTVQDTGTYLIGIMNSNYEGVAGTITSNGQEIISKNLDTNFEHYNRTSSIKVVNAKKGDTININGYNGDYYLNAFIFKLNNISINEIVSANITSDATAKALYTASKDGEKILVVSFACAKDRALSTTYSGKYSTNAFRGNDDYIDYAILNKDTTVSISAYGYNYGGGSVFILK